MQKELPRDLGVVIALLFRNIESFVGELIMGLVFLLPGVLIFIAGLLNNNLPIMLAGGFVAFLGLLQIVGGFEAAWYQVEDSYEAALFEKHGVLVDSTLTGKKWVANDQRLHLNFVFFLYEKEYSCPIATTRSNLFEKYSEGDTVPLLVLRQDPTLLSLASLRSSGRSKAL